MSKLAMILIVVLAGCTHDEVTATLTTYDSQELREFLARCDGVTSVKEVVGGWKAECRDG